MIGPDMILQIQQWQNDKIASEILGAVMEGDNFADWFVKEDDFPSFEDNLRQLGYDVDNGLEILQKGNRNALGKWQDDRWYVRLCW